MWIPIAESNPEINAQFVSMGTISVNRQIYANLLVPFVQHSMLQTATAQVATMDIS